MKNPILFLTLTFSFFQSSCSNKPNDEELLKSITKLEEEDISKYQDLLYAGPCGTFKSLKIPKSYTYTNSNEYDELEKKVLDEFAINNIIKMKQLANQDLSSMQSVGGKDFLLTIKKYEIELMEDGEKIKLGENVDNFVLKKYDNKQITIINKEYNNTNDTLTVSYSMARTQLQQLLARWCTGDKQKYITKNDTSDVKFIYKDKDWKIIK